MLFTPNSDCTIQILQAGGHEKNVFIFFNVQNYTFLKRKNLTSEWKKGEHLSYNICPFSEGPQRSLPYDM